MAVNFYSFDSLKEGGGRPDSLPEIPMGVIERLKAVMELWHSDPQKASWFIDPEIALKMWGESRSGKSTAFEPKDDDEAKLKELWLTNPESATRFVKPTLAIKKYGRPPGVNWERLVQLQTLYDYLKGMDDEGGESSDEGEA